MLDNPFFGLDSATLATLKTKTLDAIQAVLLSVSRADLNQLNQMLGQIVDAIDYNSGATTDTTFVSFNGN